MALLCFQMHHKVKTFQMHHKVKTWRQLMLGLACWIFGARQTQSTDDMFVRLAAFKVL
jgi:hypothetical protein